MAGIIEVGSQTSLTLYAVLRNTSAQVWNGSAFESYNSSNWSTYDIALTEQTSSGYYSGTFPVVAAGKYTVVVHQQLGGSPALLDPVIAIGSVYWNGTSEEVGAETALVNIKLDKLINVTAGATPPTIGSYLDKVMNKNAGQTFDPTTDSLEALRDSGTGPTVGQIADAVWDEVLDGSHVTADSAAERLKAIDNKLPSGNLSDFDETVNNVNLASDQSGVTVGTVNNLGTNAKAHVNTEVADVLFADTIAELSSGAPDVTPTIAKALMLLYMALRNKRTDSTTESKIYTNAGGVITKAQLSDNGTEFTKENYSAP